MQTAESIRRTPFSLCSCSVVVPITLVLVCLGPVSGYGTVSSTCAPAALLLVVQTDPLTVALALPKPRSLEDLLHKLLEGTLDAVLCLRTGLWTKEERVTEISNRKLVQPLLKHVTFKITAIFL